MKNDDPIFEYISQEQIRQSEVLEMIPSENYVSPAVRLAVGSVLMNKYAEGTVGKRYYQGNGVIDQVELLCQTRALQLFGLDSKIWGVNVQPYSGSPANLEIYNAILAPGDRILSMYLPDGGHLSHGWQLPDKKLTLVSKIYNINFYHVDPKTQIFDYDQIEKQARVFCPKLIISGGTAYAREIDHERMGKIAHSIGAYYLADISHESGLVAAGVNISPFPYADTVMMTTHKTLRGPRGAMIFAKQELMSNIDSSVFPGLQGGPHEHTIAGIAIALGEAQTESFKKYARQVIKNAQTLADDFIKAGIHVVSGGTDKHLVLLDMRPSKISARIAALALEYAGIVVNRNTVPSETGSSFNPSGIRLGTPAITTRGMKKVEMHQISNWILEVFEYTKQFSLPEDPKNRKAYMDKLALNFSQNQKLKIINQTVKKMCQLFPVP
jgi:glycine hydroxymethyltransferase